MSTVLTGGFARRAATPTGFFGELIEEIDVRERRREERERTSASDRKITSIEEYGSLIPEPRYGPIDLDNFPFQREPFYSDEVALAAEVVYKKSTQIGATTGLWRWAIHRADQFGERIVYFFPTKDDVTDFGDSRIEPGIQASEYLRSRLSAESVRRKTYKQIGLGDITLRGMKSRAGVQSIDADGIVIDEYDDCDEKNIAQAERRISGAEGAGRIGRVRRSGRPSIPGYGIDLQYEASDQRHWLVVCPDCGDEQPLTFGDNLRWLSEAGGDKVLREGHDEFGGPKDVVEAWRACRRCDASLEPSEPGAHGPIHRGRWVAAMPGRGRAIGFHLPRLIVPRTNLAQMVESSRATRISEMEAHHNADRGEAWALEDAQLTDADLDRAAHSPDALPANVEGYDGRYVRVAGLDAASERDLTLCVDELLPDGRRRAVHKSEPKTFDEVDKIINRLGVSCLAGDHLPETRLMKGLARNNPGRVFMVQYNEQPGSDTLRYDEERNLITVNRTESIDAMMDGIRQGDTIPLQVAPPRWREQMKALKRRLVESPSGKPRKVYEKTGTSGDDYAHAEVYSLVAEQMVIVMGLADDSAEAAAGHAVNSPGAGAGPAGDVYDPGVGEDW